MQTYIAVNEETGIIKSYVGEDATRLYQVKIIIQGLKALKLGMRLTRTATPKALFAMATKLTGTTYRRGEYDKAITELQFVVALKQATIPVVYE